MTTTLEMKTTERNEELQRIGINSSFESVQLGERIIIEGKVIGQKRQETGQLIYKEGSPGNTLVIVRFERSGKLYDVVYTGRNGFNEKGKTVPVVKPMSENEYNEHNFYIGRKK